MECCHIHCVGLHTPSTGSVIHFTVSCPNVMTNSSFDKTFFCFIAVSFHEAGHRSSALWFMEMLNMKYYTVKARRVNTGEVLHLLEVSGQLHSTFATLIRGGVGGGTTGTH